MSFLNVAAALIGWAVLLLWLLGALGLGDFLLRFGPAKPPQRPAVCQCQSMAHPEQCDEGPGCRWMRRLAKHNPDNLASKS